MYIYRSCWRISDAGFIMAPCATRGDHISQSVFYYMYIYIYIYIYIREAFHERGRRQ